VSGEPEVGAAVADLEPVDLPARWPLRRVVAWALIGIGVLAFIVAGDVRTNWIVGDIAPELGEVALPRLGTIAVLIGLTLLAWHQAIARKGLPANRYRGPSVLVLLVLIAGLSTLLVLPVRGTINLAFEGGVPDLVPVLIWVISTHAALLIVTWLVLRAEPMPGLRLFADSRPMRHFLIGVAVGIPTQIAVLVLAAALAGLEEGLIQVPTGPPVGIFLPGVPLWLGALTSIVLAPIAEELFFRGLALNAWLREYGLWPALLASSALFGLVHFGLAPVDLLPPELPRLAVLAGGGVVLGLLALRTGSLIAPITAHAAMNGVTVLAWLAITGLIQT
jgi:membrane protease YdiL (CAAX protease family)